MDQVIKGDGDKDAYLYRLTCPQEKAVKPDQGTAAQKETVLSLPPWARATPKAEPSPSRPLSPSRPEEEDDAVLSPLKSVMRKARDQKRFHRGRLIHRLLEILPDLAQDKRESVPRNFLSPPAYALSSQDIHQITDQIMGILTNPGFAVIFSENSRAEVPIIGLAGTAPISGQVDRLVVTESHVMIIDYKTNRPPPEKAENVSRLYLRQMAAYRKVLSDIYPDKDIKCLLLWTDVARLMPLPDHLLDQIIF
jgi:ATP-dependent helicase/nuclease subunit A